MKLAILTAVHGRRKLTEEFLKYYQYMDVEVLCASYTDKEDGWLLEDYKAVRVPAKNNPLSNKWQSGLTALSVMDVDAVMILGSDDFVNPGYIDSCKYLLQGGAEYVSLPGCYFFDTQTKRMIWGAAERLGLGRCISRGLLERLDWTLWPGGLNQGLDGAMWERVSNLGNVRHVRLDEARKHRFIGMDVKTGENMWSFDHIRDNILSFDVEPVHVLDEHFPTLSNTLMNWDKL